MEVWKIIEDCSRYVVNKVGVVKNTQTDFILKSGIDRYGYGKIILVRDDGRKLYTTIHRLVAKAFVQKTDPTHNQVNHIDGVKLNNDYRNLEWCSVQQNIAHSFEHLLNPNTNPVILRDLETKTEERFRSIKSLSKHLNIYASVLVPLIKNSERNPILGRYVIVIEDESALVVKANTKNFGREVFVFDGYNGETLKYPSVLVAAYHTGLRSLSNLNNIDVIQCIGYIAGFNEGNVRELSLKWLPDPNLEKARESYLIVPYHPRNDTYQLYDYWEHREYTFTRLDQMVDFMNENLLVTPIVTANKISLALAHGKETGQPWLLRGYGVKSDRHGFEWRPISEEVLLCSKHSRSSAKVFRVRNEESETLVFGLIPLAKLVGHLGLISEQEIFKAIRNRPDLRVTRLDKPIQPKRC